MKIAVLDLPGGDCVFYRPIGEWPVSRPIPIPDPEHPERYAPVIDLAERRKRREDLPQAA